MLNYRGLSKLREWDLRDINQVLFGLNLCLMNADTAKHRMLESWVSFVNHDEDPTYTEWCVYEDAIRSMHRFIKEIRDDLMLNIKNRNSNTRIIHFDNPPLKFTVKGKRIYIYGIESNDVANILVSDMKAKGWEVIIGKLKSESDDYEEKTSSW